MSDKKNLAFTEEFRPKTLAEVVGQESLKKELGAILRTGRVPGAIGLYGDTSAGKTTTARIIARALLCLNPRKDIGDACGECNSCKSFDNRHSDYFETNAAKDRGIDAMRDLATKIQMRPMLSPYRIVFFDEAHKITNDAWNMLLKVFEDPPEHVRFIIATTEPQKVPSAIGNRLLPLRLRGLKKEEVVSILHRVWEAKGMAEEGITEADLSAIAVASRRVPRAALIALDHLYTVCIDAGLMNGKVDREQMATYIQDVTTSDAEQDALIVMKAILTGKPANALAALGRHESEAAALLDHCWAMSKALLTFSIDPAVFAEDTPFYEPLTVNNKTGQILSVFKLPDATSKMLHIHERFTRAIRETSDYTVAPSKVVFAAVVDGALVVQSAKKGPMSATTVATTVAPTDVMSNLNQANNRTKVPE